VIGPPGELFSETNDNLGSRVGQRGRKGGLGEAIAPKGFRVLPRRWVVGRTFSWIDQNRRRMSKDYERQCASGEAFVYATMIHLMMRRLART
jgi:transposase